MAIGNIKSMKTKIRDLINTQRNAGKYSQTGRFKMIDQYLIVLEKSETGFSAYSPDVVGCIATGETLEATTALMRSALFCIWRIWMSCQNRVELMLIWMLCAIRKVKSFI